MPGAWMKEPGPKLVNSPRLWPRPGNSPLLVWVLLLLLCTSCTSPKLEEELRKENQALKAEITALKEKVAQLEAGQQQLAGQLAKLTAPPELSQPPGASPGVTEPLSVGQLLKDRDRLMGTRVIVQGEPGPVMMHRKSLLLKSPQGLVEVFFGNLPDKKQMHRLTSQNLTRPLTVTGTVQPPSGQDPATVRVIAEAVEF
ncbi:MAG: hypothetical protein AB1491_14080 [Thermodesulfobacteriota bacterium]